MDRGVVIKNCILLFGVFTLPYASMSDIQSKIRQLALANNQFAFNLHKLASAESSDNIFMSPLSISTAMAMLHYGVKGQALNELREVLGYQDVALENDAVHKVFHTLLTSNLKTSKSDEYILNTANSILVDDDYELKPEYRRDIEQLYEAVVRDVDFQRNAGQVIEEVNDWVKEKTRGKIEKLLDSLSPSAKLLLLNAIYFKGTWQTQFEKKQTRPDNFYNNGNQAKQVSMMHIKTRFPYTRIYDCQALELPYKGRNVSMIVLLPLSKDGLASLENSLRVAKFNIIRQQLYTETVIVSLPKFKVEYSREISDDIKTLGATKIFSGNADFSGMTDKKYVSVSNILHKAVVEVNEEGSEAAAVTGIGINRIRPSMDITPEFRADHPFLFAIVDNRSGMILFLGRVNNL